MLYLKLNKIYTVQECDATGDAIKNKSPAHKYLLCFGTHHPVIQ